MRLPFSRWAPCHNPFIGTQSGHSDFGQFVLSTSLKVIAWESDQDTVIARWTVNVIPDTVMSTVSQPAG